MDKDKPKTQDEDYVPKVHDFRAQSRFKPMPDGTVKLLGFGYAGYIDPRDTVILDPIF